MELNRISLRGASLGRVPLPRISLQGRGGDTPLDFSGYPLALDLPNARSMRTYTLFGNTSEDAKGVGDEVVQIFPNTLAEATKKGITYKVENGRLTANGTRTEAGEIIQIIGEVKAGHTYVGVFGLEQPQFNVQLFKSGAGSIYWHKGNSVVRPTADMNAYLQIGLGGKAGVSYDIDTIPSLLDITGTPYEDASTADDFAHRLGYADAEHLPAFPYGSSFVAPIRVASAGGETLYPSVLSSPLHKIGDIVDYKESNGKEWHGLKRRKMKDLNWELLTSGSTPYFRAGVIEKADGATNFFSPEYTIDTRVVTQMGDKTIKGNPSGYYLYVRDSRYATAAEFKAHFTDEDYIVYELATPTEVQGEPLPRLAIPRGTSIVTLDTAVEPSNITAKV